MRATSPDAVRSLSPWRRFLVTIQLDPTKALICYTLIGILLFTAVLGTFCAGVFWQIHARADDTKDAPLRTGTAIVQSKSPWSRATKMNPSNSGLTLDVRIEGKQTSTPPMVDERTFGVRIGDRIQVKYRVGKSGAVYIEEWEPAPR